MKKYFLMFAVYALCLGLSIGLFGCNRSDNRNEAQSATNQLAVPANLSISVAGRLVTVTWNAVNNASGYIIHATSPGCASGNRIVNTATKSATTHAGAATNSSTAENGITNRGNGFVTFTGETSFTIWLMPESGSQTVPMASSVTANVKAVGDGVNFADSNTSAVVQLNKANYGPAR